MKKIKTIVCYGDSNTYGCDPRWTPEWDMDPGKTVRLPRESRWTQILQKKLGGEFQVIEEGLPGRTTVFRDPISPHLNGKTSIRCCIETHRPMDLMIIMLGTNDLKISYAPTEDICGRAMDDLLKTVLNPYLWEHNRPAKILLVSPVEIRDSLPGTNFAGLYDDRSVLLSRELGKIYEGLSIKHGCEFLNAAAYARASDLDCIHMDPENHEKLADALKDKILSILQ